MRRRTPGTPNTRCLSMPGSSWASGTERPVLASQRPRNRPAYRAGRWRGGLPVWPRHDRLVRLSKVVILAVLGIG